MRHKLRTERFTCDGHAGHCPSTLELHGTRDEIDAELQRQGWTIIGAEPYAEHRCPFEHWA